MYLVGMLDGGQPSPAPPEFLHLAAHPLRWSLLRELAAGDRSVRQLCDAVHREQSLVSYHLGRLRKSGLASARRSSADGRDAYYRLDLERCGSLLWDAASAIHPGLGPQTGSRPSGGPPPRVLFLCTGNSARSLMAQALLSARAGPPTIVGSAGSRPKPIHPHAIRVMTERGIDTSSWRPKHLDEVLDEPWDHVVTLCDRVREVCPDFGSGSQRIHWSTPDPSVAASPDVDTYPSFVALAEDLDRRIDYLLPRIHRTTRPTEGAPTS